MPSIPAYAEAKDFGWLRRRRRAQRAPSIEEDAFNELIWEASIRQVGSFRHVLAFSMIRGNAYRTELLLTMRGAEEQFTMRGRESRPGVMQMYFHQQPLPMTPNPRSHRSQKQFKLFLLNRGRYIRYIPDLVYGGFCNIPLIRARLRIFLVVTIWIFFTTPACYQIVCIFIVRKAQLQACLVSAAQLKRSWSKSR
jgi:hypothetical protein